MRQMVQDPIIRVLAEGWMTPKGPIGRKSGAFRDSIVLFRFLFSTSAGGPGETPFEGALQGISVQNLTPALRQQLGGAAERQRRGDR